MKCSLCSIALPDTKNNQRRLRNAKSGMIFCSKDHKNQALKKGMAGDKKFKALVPQHYGIYEEKRTTEICPGCLESFLPKTKTQIYCKSKCVTTKASREKLEKWLNGDDSIAMRSDHGLAAWARRYLLEEVHYACSRCRWSEISANGTIPLEVDHIDGNWKNSARSNLRVLCPNCHSLTSNYKIYNAGNNEQSRYAYFKDKDWW